MEGHHPHQACLWFAFQSRIVWLLSEELIAASVSLIDACGMLASDGSHGLNRQQ